jgi:hypothetical protein
MGLLALAFVRLIRSLHVPSLIALPSRPSGTSRRTSSSRKITQWTYKDAPATTAHKEQRSIQARSSPVNRPEQRKFGPLQAYTGPCGYCANWARRVTSYTTFQQPLWTDPLLWTLPAHRFATAAGDAPPVVAFLEQTSASGYPQLSDTPTSRATLARSLLLSVP